MHLEAEESQWQYQGIRGGRRRRVTPLFKMKCLFCLIFLGPLYSLFLLPVCLLSCPKSGTQSRSRGVLSSTLTAVWSSASIFQPLVVGYHETSQPMISLWCSNQNRDVVAHQGHNKLRTKLHGYVVPVEPAKPQWEFWINWLWRWCSCMLPCAESCCGLFQILFCLKGYWGLVLPQLGFTVVAVCGTDYN